MTDGKNDSIKHSMIDREEIRKIARLAKLSVPEEELDGLTADMDQILSFADTINTAGVQGEEFDSVSGLSNAFREDEVVPSYPREAILRNVDGGEDGFFYVQKRR